MGRFLLAFLSVVLLGMGSTGCATVARLRAPILTGEPGSSGLVIVDVDVVLIAAILGIRTHPKPVAGDLARVDGIVLKVRGGATSSLVVFPDLLAGQWTLLEIQADWNAGNGQPMRLTFPVPPGNVTEFTLDVRAGEAHYIGMRIEDDRRLGSFGVRYTRRYDADVEKKAWQWMDRVYKSTPWGPVIRAKLGAPDTTSRGLTPPRGR